MKNFNMDNSNITTKPIIIKAIQDIVHESFNKSLVLTLFIANSNLNSERKEKLDKSVMSIAYGTNLIDKYTYAITSGNVPNIMRRKIKAYAVFLDDFPRLSKNEEDMKKILNYINASQILIFSLDVESTSDYMVYFKFLDFMKKNKKNIISRPIGNFFIAKKPTSPNMDLELSSLSDFLSFPQSTIISWTGTGAAQLKTNMTGFEEINDANQQTLGKQISACVASTLYEVFLNSGVNSSELDSYIELINGNIGEK